jgi:hypothetical protein
VETNGRLAMMLFREAEREKTLQSIQPYLNRPGYDKAFTGEVERLRPYLKPRNVHLLILESFLDPRLFRDLKLSRDPVHPDFAALFGDQLGLSISPVFGGATSQAEFEVLCGVPALERLSSVEFNTFTGAPARCLPDLLVNWAIARWPATPTSPTFSTPSPHTRVWVSPSSISPRNFCRARLPTSSLATRVRKNTSLTAICCPRTWNSCVAICRNIPTSRCSITS